MSNKVSLSGAWLPVALLHQIPPKSVHPIVVNGEQRALWRDEDGQIHIWEDRCPHRGMRLSFGTVTGGSLTCLYHGWRFSAEGVCKHIPAHPDMEPPGSITVPSFTVRLSRGVVMMAAGPDETDRSEPGDEGWHGIRSIYLNRSISDAIEVMTKPQFQMGGSKLNFDGLCTLTGKGLQICVQPMSDTETALHLCAQTDEPETQLTLARELVALRRIINAADL